MTTTTHEKEKPELYKSVKQAAELFQVSEHVVRRLVNSGKLGHYRIGNAIRITGKHIDEYLQAHATPKIDSLPEPEEIHF